MGNVTYRTCDNCENKELSHKSAKKGWMRVGGQIEISYKGFSHRGFRTLDFCSLECLREYLKRRIDKLENDKGSCILGFRWPRMW